MTQPADRLEAAVYNALRDFQQTADWPQLRLAQMRQHLAEHIARDLTLTPGALPTAPDSISVADLAHALDNSTPYPIELTSTVARFMAERLLEMLTIGKRAEHPVWQSEEQSEPGEQPQPEDPEGLRLLTAKDSEPCAVRRETVQYFLECRSADGSRWESPILTLDDPDEAARQLARYRGEMPHFEYRLARETTTVVVQPLPEPAVSSAGQAPATDHTALRERLAAAVRSITTVGGAPPRLLVPVIASGSPRMARIVDWQPLDDFLDKVLAAVLPAPADQAAARAAALREAADAVFALEYDVMVGEEGDENLGSMREAWDVGTIHASQLLRRMADQTPEGDPACAHCGGNHTWDNCETYTRLVTADEQPAAAWQDGERPRCPHCQMPHDLTPDSLPARTCAGVRQRIAEAARLHTEGEHRLCTPSDCDTIRARQAEPWDVPDARPSTTDHTLAQQPAAARQDGATS